MPEKRLFPWKIRKNGWMRSVIKAKYKLELLRPAQRELEEIALVHMELAGIESARKITDRIFRALEHLRNHSPISKPNS